MWEKRLSIFLVALLVVSCCVWALPGAKKAVKETQEVVEEEAPQTSISVDSQNSSQSEATETSIDLDEALKILKGNNFIIGADKINAVATAVEEVASNQELSNALIATQNQQIESLKKEVNATRFFADLGVAFGFKDKGINYGVVGDMGLKLGKGFITKVGVQYMLGDLSNIGNLQWSLENMTVQTTVGWEW